MLLYPLCYYLRNMTLAYIAVFLEGHPEMQLILMIHLNLATMAVLLLVKPYIMRQDKRKELLGELLNLFMTQMFFCLLNVDMAGKVRGCLEWTTFAVLGLVVLCVSIVQLSSSLVTTRRCCKRKCSKKRDSQAKPAGSNSVAAEEPRIFSTQQIQRLG